MPLVRMWCDKQLCVFCDNEQCVSPEMPRWTTPAEVTVEDFETGKTYSNDNDTLSRCDRFVMKG